MLLASVIVTLDCDGPALARHVDNPPHLVLLLASMGRGQLLAPAFSEQFSDRIHYLDRPHAGHEQSRGSGWSRRVLLVIRWRLKVAVMGEVLFACFFYRYAAQVLSPGTTHHGMPAVVRAAERVH